MFWEVRQALLLNRLAAAPGVGGGPVMAARTPIQMATAGGAALLGRSDIGRIAPGCAADLIAVDLDRIGWSGGLHDPVAAIALCGLSRVDHSWVGGRPVVVAGELSTVELEPLMRAHEAASLRLVNG
jgi:cytosine/adenosine deaminase-related metal-dependent hydrolase